jgi:uncharacterized protein (TIGR00255 family)
MTGFASVSREAAGDKVHVTMKSVNHRFLDVSLKVPQALAAIEQRVKSLVAARLSRGRVEVQVAGEVTRMPEREVVVDERLVDQLATAVEGLRARGVVSGPLSAGDVLRVSQVLEIRTKAADSGAELPEALVALLEHAVNDALGALLTMRDTEGTFLATDLASRLATIAGYVDALEREAADGQRRLEARLRERVAQLPPDLQGDPAALAQEIVRVVARSDVDEEVVRLRGHLEHWQGLATGPEPCGRKLDFLAQEMNREVNTIGSKVEGTRATELVISAKAELERIKEQVQNVE